MLRQADPSGSTRAMVCRWPSTSAIQPLHFWPPTVRRSAPPHLRALRRLGPRLLIILAHEADRRGAACGRCSRLGRRRHRHCSRHPGRQLGSCGSSAVAAKGAWKRCGHVGGRVGEAGRVQRARPRLLPQLRVDRAQLLVQALQLLLAPPGAHACRAQAARKLRPVRLCFRILGTWVADIQSLMLFRAAGHTPSLCARLPAPSVSGAIHLLLTQHAQAQHGQAGKAASEMPRFCSSAGDGT